MSAHDTYWEEQRSGLNDPVEADAEIRSRNFNRRVRDRGVRCVCWNVPRMPKCDDCLIREDEEC